MALTPNLTPLDRRVLEAVQTPQQASHLTAVLIRRHPETMRGLGSWDVTAILRGLEHLGLVKRKAGGWWVATAKAGPS